MIQLRPYQREAIDAISTFFVERGGNPLIVLPTGSGKSIVIGKFVREAIEGWPGTRILVLAHVPELIAQNYAELISFWPDAPAGIYSAKLGKRQIASQILFAGIQSVHRKAYDLQKVDLVLVDECHLIPRASDTMYGRLLGQLKEINPYLKIVGFTATPFRLDSGRLDRGDGAMFDGIAYDANLRDLIEAGWLAPPISQPASAQIDTAGVKITAGEFNARQLEGAATRPEIVAAVADELVRHGATRLGWLVFGCGVRHCELLRDALQERGISCESVFGDTPAQQRLSTVSRFKRQQIRALSSCGVLTTGFNAQHVDLIALARPTKSTGLYIQIVGRGTRIFPGKTDCLVLDFGGNIARHGPVDQPKPHKEPHDKQDREPEAPVKLCPNCEAPNHVAARECADCGFPFPIMMPALQTRASDLAVLSTHPAAPQWVPVTGVAYSLHQKAGKPPSLLVTYRCGLTSHREWICVEHDGPAQRKAQAWWRKHTGNAPVPGLAREALTLAEIGVLKKPTWIAIRPNGQYTEVMGHMFGEVSSGSFLNG